MKTLLALLLACLLFSCNDHSESKNGQKVQKTGKTGQKMEVPYSQRIAPASHLGSIKIEEEAKRVYDSLGPADASDAAMQKAVATWYSDDPKSLLTIFTAIKDQEGMEHKIYLVRSTSPRFKTENGLGVNSTMEAVNARFLLEKRGVFTENGQQYTLYETKEGIGFEFDKDQKCHGIIIHERGARANQTYLPIYADFNFKNSN